MYTGTDDEGVKHIIFPRFYTSSNRERKRKIRNDGGGLGRRVGVTKLVYRYATKKKKKH